MAIYLKAKAPTAVARYEWPVPVREGDSVATFVPTVSSGTAVIDSYETEGDTGVLIVSGGAADEVTVIAITATTDEGETVIETAYLPVIASTNALDVTGADIASYVLRKVAGIGDTATGDELSDVFERISAMLAAWNGQGANLGIPLPVDEGTLFLCDDAFIQAIKANGILAIADLYEYTPSPFVVEQARRGLQQIKASLLSTDERAAVYY